MSRLQDINHVMMVVLVVGALLLFTLVFVVPAFRTEEKIVEGYIWDIDYVNGVTIVHFTNGENLKLNGFRTEIPYYKTVRIYYEESWMGVRYLKRVEII